MGHVRLVLPDELHFGLKRQALEERVSLTTLLIKALGEYLDNRKETQENAENVPPLVMRRDSRG